MDSAERAREPKSIEKNEYRKMPELINAEPEEVAKAIMQGPPKKKWRFQTRQQVVKT